MKLEFHFILVFFQDINFQKYVNFFWLKFKTIFSILNFSIHFHLKFFTWSSNFLKANDITMLNISLKKEHWKKQNPEANLKKFLCAAFNKSFCFLNMQKKTS